MRYYQKQVFEIRLSSLTFVSGSKAGQIDALAPTWMMRFGILNSRYLPQKMPWPLSEPSYLRTEYSGKRPVGMLELFRTRVGQVHGPRKGMGQDKTKRSACREAEKASGKAC
jgi:hypothetical protein